MIKSVKNALYLLTSVYKHRRKVACIKALRRFPLKTCHISSLYLPFVSAGVKKASRAEGRNKENDMENMLFTKSADFGEIIQDFIADETE
ncbi:MAG: hypothetical protein SPD11_06405 [Sphaerochaetaceae bacterium]|nr:hypothetical protein [Sphaerochaetaceae bacterium]